ncbi:hypothetical protein D039_1195B, partial [Vibrio parahaemolyticus EKP-028]
FLLWVTM